MIIDRRWYVYLYAFFRKLRIILLDTTTYSEQIITPYDLPHTIYQYYIYRVHDTCVLFIIYNLLVLHHIFYPHG